jgi:hypothetical protein
MKTGFGEGIPESFSPEMMDEDFTDMGIAMQQGLTGDDAANILDTDEEDAQSSQPPEESGDFVKMAGKGSAKTPAKGSLEATTPGELEGMPDVSQAGPAPGAGYNWQKAYQYTRLVFPKFSPFSSDVVLDYKTGQPVINEPRVKAGERKAKAGASSVTVGDFGKPATNKLEEGMIDASDGIRRLERVRESFDPDYLTLGTKWSNIVSAGKEKLGMTLSGDEKEKLEDFTKFKRTTLANINRYIKDITGAAMSESEAKRITASMPNVDDSPSEFKTKLEDVTNELADTLEAYDAARTRGPVSLVPYTKKKAGTKASDKPGAATGKKPTHKYNPATGNIELVK